MGFAYFILGVELWAFQIAFLEAIRDHSAVACAGGRKIGKDFVVAIAALWWYASWPKAKVFMLAPTSKQLDGILFLEIKELLRNSGRCVPCRKAGAPVPCPHSAVLTGKAGTLARTGVKSDDFRFIVGHTAIGQGGMRGFSGARILAIEDEASDIRDDIHNALLGNLASEDCHRCAMSNPWRTDGWFARAFGEEQHLYHTIQQSTEDNPNVVAGRQLIPGLAGRQWLEDRAIDWGRGSALWAANVEGKFPTASQGQLFSRDLLRKAASPERFAAANRKGRLQIGVDPAGAGQDGDETAIVVRRGDVPLRLHRERGLKPDEIRAKVLSFLAAHRETEDWAEASRPTIVVDCDGDIGKGVRDEFRAYRSRGDREASEFNFVEFHGGGPPIGRLKEHYRFTRDVLFAGLKQWVEDGGCIPDDAKLAGELMALRWKGDSTRGLSQLEHKSDMKERLGRSPDSADAFALSVWGGAARDAAAQHHEAAVDLAPANDANHWAHGNLGEMTGDANSWAYDR